MSEPSTGPAGLYANSLALQHLTELLQNYIASVSCKITSITTLLANNSGARPSLQIVQTCDVSVRLPVSPAPLGLQLPRKLPRKQACRPWRPSQVETTGAACKSAGMGLGFRVEQDLGEGRSMGPEPLRTQNLFFHPFCERPKPTLKAVNSHRPWRGLPTTGWSPMTLMPPGLSKPWMFIKLNFGCTLSRPWPKARSMRLQPERLEIFHSFPIFAHKSSLSILSVSDPKNTLKALDRQRPWRCL